MKIAEVNLMTVHAKLRNKKLAPILIKELQRRINLAGVWQGMGGVNRPIPG
jgi:glycylpeptide N-tetradecanoyltransferase